MACLDLLFLTAHFSTVRCAFQGLFWPSIVHVALRVSDGSIDGFYVLIVVVHDTPKMHLACVTPCAGQGSYFALGYRVRLFGAVPTAASSFVRSP